MPLRILRFGAHCGFSGWAQCHHEGPCRREVGRRQRETVPEQKLAWWGQEPRDAGLRTLEEARTGSPQEPPQTPALPDLEVSPGRPFISELQSCKVMCAWLAPPLTPASSWRGMLSVPPSLQPRWSPLPSLARQAPWAEPPLVTEGCPPHPGLPAAALARGLFSTPSQNTFKIL